MRVSIDEDILSDIGDAIREKLGATEMYAPEDMPDKILEIEGGGREPEGEITIISNGTYDVSWKESAIVNVPQGVFPYGDLGITENGHYDVTEYEGVEVMVPQGVFPEGTLDITENGTYDVTEYEEVNVSIEGSNTIYITPTSDTDRLIIETNLRKSNISYLTCDGLELVSAPGSRAYLQSIIYRPLGFYQGNYSLCLFNQYSTNGLERKGDLINNTENGIMILLESGKYFRGGTKYAIMIYEV